MILVTGASGFVGGKMMAMCSNVVACPSLRGASEDSIKRIIEETGVDTIVHTAAISDIGTCQKDAEASYAANVQIPVQIAKAAKNIKLICFSSDQVYSGAEAAGPYTEDMVKPKNIYAKHKLEMEQRVLDMNPDAVMLRAEWMYDYYLKKPNYLMNILSEPDCVNFSSRQFRGLTYVKEVAQNLEKLIQLPGGAYNLGSETTKSMFEITTEFIGLIGKRITVNDVAPAHNLWMNCDKAKQYGITFSSVEDGLKRCAQDYGLYRPV